jgi:hypothetical protein
MDFLLFLFLAFFIFGAGFFIAGLQLAIAFALFIGLLFGGAFLGLFLIGMAFSPVFILGSLFFLAWLAGRYSRRPQIEIIPPKK